MPELPDVEGFRRFFDEHAARRTVRSVHHVDRSMVRSGTSPQAIGRALAGRRLAPARRHGKLLVCPAGERRLVLHFGMTGTFVWCASGEPGHPHDRLVLEFSGGELRYRNMRRFGGIWLLNEAGADELVGRLGPDWLDVSRPAFDALVSGRRRAIKATLMDQEIAAGLGNLTADESLWQARIDPRRPAGSLDGSERRRLYAAIRKVLRDSIPYGLVPSLSGWLTSVRGERDATCPRCGAELRRVTIGGADDGVLPARAGVTGSSGLRPEQRPPPGAAAAARGSGRRPEQRPPPGAGRDAVERQLCGCAAVPTGSASACPRN